MHSLFSTLKIKLAIIILGMTLITIFLGGSIFYSLNKAKKDTDIVNAAGRQRMLSQAMAKSILSYTQSKNTIQATKNQIIELDRYITNMRGTYTDSVIAVAKKEGLKISMHPESETVSALPFPATFTRMVGEKFTSEADFSVELISEDPINPDYKLQDDVDKEAFKTLKANPKEIFVKDIEKNGKLYLQYYSADIAVVEACANCHSKMKEKDFNKGDMLGIRRFKVFFSNDVEAGRARLAPSLQEFNTAREIFTRTLEAFKSGGEYPANLQMSSIKTFKGTDDTQSLSTISKIEDKLKSFLDMTNQLTDSMLGTNEYWSSLQQVPVIANELRGLSDNLTSRFAEIAMAHQRNVSWAAGIMIAATVLAFIILFVLLNKIILHPVTVMVQAVEKISQGDLTQHIGSTRNDEIGHLSNAVDEMSQSLNDMIAKISDASAKLVKSGNNVTQAVEKVATGSMYQTDKTEMVATAASEMKVVSDNISNNTIEATEAAGQATKVAVEGGHVVRQSIQGMKRISSSVLESTEKVEQLLHLSDQIGQIVSVINDIANQTNLLALNAAIEAARAGDKGRGFAVVADEVRELATRTTDATQEIAEMIRNIQSGTEIAVSSMQDGRNEVDSGSELVTKTGESLQQIVEVVEGLTDQIKQISSSAKEQNLSMNEVNDNINNVSEIARNSQQEAERSAQSCDEISALAKDLQSMVDRFKLSLNS